MTANTVLSLGSMFFITVSLTVFIIKCLLFTGWTTDRLELSLFLFREGEKMVVCCLG